MVLFMNWNPKILLTVVLGFIEMGTAKKDMAEIERMLIALKALIKL